MKSDIEIAQEIELKPIQEIAKKVQMRKLTQLFARICTKNQKKKLLYLNTKKIPTTGFLGRWLVLMLLNCINSSWLVELLEQLLEILLEVPKKGLHGLQDTEDRFTDLD